MASNKHNLRLICYDIADPKRLSRLYRYLCDHAIPVQYSVFLAELTSSRLNQIIEDVLCIIDDRADDVRIYSLPASPWMLSLGQSVFPDGIILSTENQPELCSAN